MNLLILDIGLLPFADLEELCKKFNGDVALVGNSKSRPEILKWKSEFWKIFIDVNFKSHINSDVLISGAPLHWHDQIIRSYEATLIMERMVNDLGLAQRQVFSSRLVDIAFNLCLKYRGLISWVGTNTPHDQRWILARSLEFGGANISFTISSVLHQRVVIVKSLVEQRVLNQNTKCLDNQTAEVIKQQFLQKNSSDYKYAIPDYEKAQRLKFGIGNQISLAEIAWLIKSNSLNSAVRKLRRIKNKLSTRRFLQKNSQSTNKIQRPFVSLYLHYQPERTSIPDAGKFAYQSLIVRSLREHIPDHITIVIREHPATFRSYFEDNYRSLDFYKIINDIPNVIFSDCFNEDPFKLMDGSLMVATISSTAGSQALCRGIPVICYGPAPYRGHLGCFSMHSPGSGGNFPEWFDKVSRMPREELRRVFSKFLGAHILSSFEKDYGVNGSMEALRYMVISSNE